MRPDIDAQPAQRMNPLDAKRQFAAEGAAHYNRAAGQRERIAHRLSQGPATRSELERECRCPCVTKRISELRRGGPRRAGLTIRTRWIAETARDGSVSPAALYILDAAPDGTEQMRLALE